MSSVHLHLMTTHLPVVGTLFSWALLLLAAIKKSQELAKTAFAFFVLTGLLAVPAFFSGEPASDALKGVQGVSREAIEQHQELAQVAFICLSALALASLAALIWYRRGRVLPRWTIITLLLVTLPVGGLLGWTANLGGRVRHGEIRPALVDPIR